MIGRTHPRFWKHFHALPVAVQKLAREKYALWREHPHHPSLRFEERRNGICVVRIGDHYRADLRQTRVVVMDGKLTDADALRTAAGFSGRPK